MFSYKLALDLGMTVEELHNRINTNEFKGWVKYFEYVAEQQRRSSKSTARGGRK